MPIVTIRTGFRTPDGAEETLADYLCDVPGCPHPAVHVLGFVRELRAVALVCDAHHPANRSGGDRAAS